MNSRDLNCYVAGKGAGGGGAGGIPRPKVDGDMFGDLLGSHGFDFSTKKDSGPKTINAMRKEELAKDMDPDKMKVFILSNSHQFTDNIEYIH